MSDPDTELREDVIEDASHRGNSMDLRDLLALIERRHPGGRGVAPELVERYIDETASTATAVEGESFKRQLRENRTDAESWVGADRVYEVGDGNVSAYPSLWHDKLDGETDLATALAVIRADVDDTNEAFDVGGAGYGVPQSVLLETVSTLAGGDYHQAKLKVDDLRQNGVFEIDADQHPEARVRFTDEARPDSLEAETVERAHDEAGGTVHDGENETVPDEEEGTAHDEGVETVEPTHDEEDGAVEDGEGDRRGAGTDGDDAERRE